MAAREELLQIMGKAFEWGEKAALNEFTPDLWLRYGLEMGWVELTGTLYSVDDFDPIDDPPQQIGERSHVYRFTAGTEKEGE